MRDHELELIAALAEGRLEDETEARALIESSLEYREEYEAQRIALEALDPVTSATLSDLEKASLHREVWSQLRSTTTAPAPNPWYYRWAPVAAGMFVVVGLVAVLNNQGGDSEGAAPVAADSDSGTDTTAAGATSGGGEDAADGETGSEAPTEGGESEETATTLVSASQSIDVEDLVAADLNRALTALDYTYYSDEADLIRTSTSADPEFQTFDEESPELLNECADRAGLSGYSIVGAHPAPSEDEAELVPEDANPYVVVKPDDQDLAEAPLAFVDLITCEVVYVDE